MKIKSVNCFYSVLFQLESVIQQELEGLHANIEASGNKAPPNNLDLSHTSTTKCLKAPSLPEPTGPPPPPPLVEVNGTSEPIYESVLPRDETDASSPPPLPAPPHKLRPKSPGLERLQRNGSPTCSPRQSRPSSRGSSVSGVRITLTIKTAMLFYTIRFFVYSIHQNISSVTPLILIPTLILTTTSSKNPPYLSVVKFYHVSIQTLIMSNAVLDQVSKSLFELFLSLIHIQMCIRDSSCPSRK